MCKPTEIKFKATCRSKPTILLTQSSYHCTDEKGEKGPLSPSKTSTFLTVGFFVLLLCASEQLFIHFIKTYCAHLHPVMDVARNQQVLARHVGVDGLGIFLVSTLGIKNRHVLSPLLTVKSFKRSDSETEGPKRIHTYLPEGHQVLLAFFAYQTKNMYDTVVWNDGILFILHHLFAGATAWLGMYPGVAGVYGLFFMGISEFPTCTLCLLANFDPELGVDGLSEAFPTIKAILAVMFVTSFITIRIIVWPALTYHFWGDCLTVLKRDSVKETSTVKIALKAMMTSSALLTLLQFIWLGQIVIESKKEIAIFLASQA